MSKSKDLVSSIESTISGLNEQILPKTSGTYKTIKEFQAKETQGTGGII